jgi:dephospho-CoA kinase
LLVGVSGPICAGKTTTARFLEGGGFAYARFSQVIDEELAKQGLPMDRRSRQAAGWDLHERFGQAFLAERVLQRVSGSALIVIDGLRFIADRDFFAVRSGSAFLHVHIYADPELRRCRFEADGGSQEAFWEAEAAEVEGEVGALGKLADVRVSNDGPIEALFVAVRGIVDRAMGGGPCQFLSS